MVDWSRLRSVTVADAAACTAFSCCGTGGKYGASDIQRQVRNGKAIRRAAAEPDHVFVGAFDDASRLAGVAYHEPAPLDRVGVPARYLRFVAVHDTYQGVRAPDGQRCSDLLMHAVHNDILARHPSTEAVLVRVHPQHAVSIALLERNAYVPVKADAGAHPLHVRAL